ncbi:PDZ domain-containing protein [Persicimonas caeni]|uniref:PDZ domain-containing protein n=1 Tax=Persicimonas caeni TaxID=2292766 RepID=A0A4Y6PP47_PERCE|nr:type II secretion system protein GspC [Persicimonas caeni]QDG50108.1 PDZ domain-containing protein [Persicimonas caeni]QED31329.1 PDZ domain-containing protein [Persicimonas caeni]
MENFLRKYGWTVALALIAIGAFLLALMTNNIVASQLAPLTVPKLPDMSAKQADEPAKRQPTRRRGQNWDRTIASLCLFGCPDTTPKDECEGGCPDGQECQAGQCVPAEDQPPVDSDVPVLSDLNMKLMGAMVADNPEYSMALIRDDNSSETLVLSPGDLVTNGAELVEIRRDRVILKRNGRLEYIRMDKTIGGDPSATTASTLDRTPRPTPIKQPPRTRRASTRGSAGDSIKSVGRDKFEVDRNAINKQIEDKQDLARQGRVVPNYKNGKRDGLKLVGISPNSVYSKLGIQSGDVIHSVNGKEINTSQEAMELFERMRDSGDVTVEIERRGQKRKLNYNIR